MTALPSTLSEQVAQLRRAVAELKAQSVSYVPGEVTATDTTSNTFSAQITGLVDGSTVPLSGITAPSSFLPTVGDTVLIALAGAQPIYQPGRIAAGSVGTTEIADASVSEGKLTFDLADYGGNTIFYGSTTPSPPAAGFSGGDLWLQTTGDVGADGQPNYVVYRWDPTAAEWVALQDQGVADSLASALAAQEAAAAKATLFTQATAPDYSGAANTAYWLDTSAGGGNVPKVWNGASWVIYQLGNGAIQPNSLVASDVVATGTVSAALLEAIMVLVSTIIAGDPDGTHAALAPDGLHIYDLNGNEVIRLGTADNDYFGIVDSTGTLLASIDDGGGGSFTDLSTVNDPVFAGTALSDMLSTLPRGVIAQYFDDGTLSIPGITAETHIISVTFTAEAGRHYRITASNMTFDNSTDGIGVGAIWLMRATPAIYTDSSEICRREIQGGLLTNAGTTMIKEFPNGIPAGNYQVALNAAGANSSITVASRNTDQPIGIVVEDKGPIVTATGQSFPSGGSGTVDPPPTKQNYVTPELGPNGGRGVGYWSFRGPGASLGSGTLRTDTTEVIQGLDPSGFNGLGQGGFQFAIPTITGTVTRVDFYAYADWTYFNSGGRLILAPTAQYATFNPTLLASGWDSGKTYPKPGGRWVTLPSSWYPLFRNRSTIGIVAETTNSSETFYVKLASAPTRLKIWYTQ